MKHLKKYKEFKESLVIDLGLMPITILEESMNIWTDALLSSVKAEEANIFDTLKLPKDFYNDKLTLEFLSDNVEFVNSLSSIALKKSQIQNSEDFNTFLNKPCKFMLLYGIEKNELENPEYILFQTWDNTLKKWNFVKLYKVGDDINKFYNKLSSKTIEINDGENKYIYTTSDVSDWQLQSGQSNDTYKKVLRKDELEEILDDKKAKVNII